MTVEFGRREIAYLNGVDINYGQDGLRVWCVNSVEICTLFLSPHPNLV